MLTFCAVFLVVVSLVLPVIFLSIYCYTRDQGWKTVLWGCLNLVLVQVIQRMILPLSFGKMAWYSSLLDNPLLYLLLYSLVSALLEIALFYLSQRFLLKKLDLAKDACTLGFAYGAMEGALFSGFTALSSLLSTFDAGSGQPQDYLLIAAEVVCMWILHAAYSLLVHQGLKQKKWIDILLAFVFCYVVLVIGSAIVTVLGWHRIVLEVLLIAAAFFAGWKILPVLRQESIVQA